MITITMNNDFTLNCDTNIIPAQHSANTPFKFEVPEEYQNSLVIPGYMYYDGCRKVESAIDNYSNGNFTLPANAFSKEGMLAISFAITTGEETITTTTAEFEVRGSVNTSFSLPDETVWQNMLQNFMEQYMTKVYSSIIEDLIQKEQDHYQHTEELQIKVNDLIKKAEQQQSNVTQLIDNVNAKIENGDFIPNLQIGTVENGSQASATFTGSKENPELNLVLPQGPKGDPGDVGPQGAPGPQGPKGENGGMTTHIVDTLPESGESTDIYFLTVGDNYIPFMYVEGKWMSFSTVQSKQLLINNSFQINQRNVGYIAKSGCLVDMWFLYTPEGSDGYIEDLSGKGVAVVSDGNPGFILRQIIDNRLRGKTVTIVGKFKDVNTTSGGIKLTIAGTNTVRELNTSYREVSINGEGVYKITVDIPQDIDYKLLEVAVVFTGSVSCKIDYIDLFEGNIAYPHVVEDKDIALMRCQNRLVVYSELRLPCDFSYINRDYDSISVILYLPTNFKGQPNISYDTKEMRSQHGGTTYTDFSIVDKKLYGTNIVRIIWKKDSGTFPNTIKDAYVYMKNLVISCEET